MKQDGKEGRRGCRPFLLFFWKIGRPARGIDPFVDEIDTINFLEGE
ncbi:hypothetical protein BN871_IQ_00200 [Paenibacillus sp. P22]|nr:hypothetical protein BN871_IQ_00200 [Paenibacillus sp. P22]